MKNKTGGCYSVLVPNQATLKTLNKKNGAMLHSEKKKKCTFNNRTKPFLVSNSILNNRAALKHVTCKGMCVHVLFILFLQHQHNGSNLLAKPHTCTALPL